MPLNELVASEFAALQFRTMPTKQQLAPGIVSSNRWLEIERAFRRASGQELVMPSYVNPLEPSSVLLVNP